MRIFSDRDDLNALEWGVNVNQILLPQMREGEKKESKIQWEVEFRFNPLLLCYSPNPLTTESSSYMYLTYENSPAAAIPTRASYSHTP